MVRDDVHAAVVERIEQKANVDFSLGALAMIAGLPLDGGEVIMSIARIAGSRLVRLPRGGHSATVEEPELVNAALIPFIDEHSGGARRTG